MVETSRRLRRRQGWSLTDKRWVWAGGTECSREAEELGKDELKHLSVVGETVALRTPAEYPVPIRVGNKTVTPAKPTRRLFGVVR
jgi:hypothetical protein